MAIVIPLLVATNYVIDGTSRSLGYYLNEYIMPIGVSGSYQQKNGDLIQSYLSSNSQLYAVIDEETGLLNYYSYKTMEEGDEKLFVQIKRESYTGTNTILPE
jgi:hypothetical protein